MAKGTGPGWGKHISCLAIWLWMRAGCSRILWMVTSFPGPFRSLTSKISKNSWSSATINSQISLTSRVEAEAEVERSRSPEAHTAPDRHQLPRTSGSCSPELHDAVNSGLLISLDIGS
ncbi:hypothetical protein GB937_004083 [Aspergillus fischeri]|nr:hypothetical protein GB937_004083 [Aspergillus fischeri]